ncbi:hypothetical protein pb186bvf_006428 [Paramecium bursaria]
MVQLFYGGVELIDETPYCRPVSLAGNCKPIIRMSDSLSYFDLCTQKLYKQDTLIYI